MFCHFSELLHTFKIWNTHDRLIKEWKLQNKGQVKNIDKLQEERVSLSVLIKYYLENKYWRNWFSLAYLYTGCITSFSFTLQTNEQIHLDNTRKQKGSCMKTESSTKPIFMLVQSLNKYQSHILCQQEVMYTSYLNINPYSVSSVQNICEGLISWWTLGFNIHCLTIPCQSITAHGSAVSPISWKGSVAHLSNLHITIFPPIKSCKPKPCKTTTFTSYSVLVNIHIWLSIINTNKM